MKYTLIITPEMDRELKEMAHACGCSVEQFIIEAAECKVAERRIAHT